VTRRFLLIPGINQDLGSVAGWAATLCRHIEKRQLGFAECFEYAVNAFDQGIWAAKHTNQVATILSEWVNPGEEVVTFTHSHGCGLILDALLAHPGLGVYHMVLLAAAAPADYARHLNTLVNRGQVRKVDVWYSANDTALKLAPLVGMGQLGLVGPKNMNPEARARTLARDHGGDHSDMLRGDGWADRLLDTITEK